MIIAFRLYRQHDMDLVTLACDPDFHLNREIKKVLVADANGTEYHPKHIPNGFDTTGYVPKIIRIQFSLSEGREDERQAIKLLQTVKRGYRCSFLKAIFRNEYETLPISAYMTDSNFHLRKHQSYDEDEAEENKEADEMPMEQKPESVPDVSSSKEPVSTETSIVEEVSKQIDPKPALSPVKTAAPEPIVPEPGPVVPESDSTPKPSFDAEPLSAPESQPNPSVPEPAIVPSETSANEQDLDAMFERMNSLI